MVAFDNFVSNEHDDGNDRYAVTSLNPH